MTILEIIDQLLVQDEIKNSLVDYAKEYGYCKENGHAINWPSTTRLINEDDLPVSFDKENRFYLEDNLGCKWFFDVAFY